MKRRTFIRQQGLLLSGMAVSPWIKTFGVPFGENDFTSNRPPLAQRTFTSQSVEDHLNATKSMIRDPELAWMFENCYPNTLDTTVDYEIIDGKPDTFIITGDIDAMWLRDSTAQVWPYMPLITEDDHLKMMIKGLVNRQVKCVLKDPYANAFYKDLTKKSDWQSDTPTPIPGVHERKWEIDSLCYPIRLAYHYYKLTGDREIFDENWNTAMRTIVDTFITEQRKDGTSPYYFIRRTTSMMDAPVFGGTGRPIKPNGFICSMFRPSDDATNLPFLIPSNIFALISLRQLAEIYQDVLMDSAFAEKCTALADEVEQAIMSDGIADHPVFGKIYAYETDGFGNHLFMDDANVPSLMSLAYLGAHIPEDEIYQNTRKFLLSDDNPYFLHGKAATGQASPHTGKDMIWPMGIILRAMTSTNDGEILLCLRMLKNTHAGTGFMHEAFNKDDASKYTRSWFAWANTLFGELIIKVGNERPHLLSRELK